MYVCVCVCVRVCVCVCVTDRGRERERRGRQRREREEAGVKKRPAGRPMGGGGAARRFEGVGMRVVGRGAARLSVSDVEEEHGHTKVHPAPYFLHAPIDQMQHIFTHTHARARAHTHTHTQTHTYNKGVSSPLLSACRIHQMQHTRTHTHTTGIPRCIQPPIFCNNLCVCVCVCVCKCVCVCMYFLPCPHRLDAAHTHKCKEVRNI